MSAHHPSRTALLVVDVQCAFDEWQEAGRKRNNPAALARIVDLLAAFRQAAMPVFHIRHQGSLPGSRFLPFATGYAVKDEAREIGEEPVLVKQVNSAFIGTGLETLLREAAIRTVVICGATTNHCVETTTRMAGNLGFDACLVRDATWAFDLVGPDGDLHLADAVHAMSLANLSGEFARIVRTEEVIHAIQAKAGPRSEHGLG